MTMPLSTPALAEATAHGHCAVASGSLRWSRVERRFGELVVKEAIGTITQEESAKLERYQRLRREMAGTADVTPEQARKSWETDQMMKAVKRLIRKASENNRNLPADEK